MSSSGYRGSGEDPKRKRCVAADAARKRSPGRYTNYGLQVPVSLLRREIEEYDSCHARCFDAGSSSGAPPLPVKREPSELPPLRNVKGGHGEACRYLPS